MVLWPQGADQPINAARAVASGTAITVDAATAISAAVTETLDDGAYRDRARAIADEIAQRPRPAHGDRGDHELLARWATE